MSQSAAFKAACMGATLATAWAATPAQATSDFRITYQDTLQNPIEHASVFYGGGAGTLVLHGGSSLGMVMGPGSTGWWQGTVCLAMPDDAASRPWSMAGLTSDGHVVVSFSNGAAFVGHSFSECFPGYDEAVVADQILSGSPQVFSFLDAFSSRVSGTPSFSTSVLMYSNAVDIGTVSITLTPVPAPGALVLGAISGAALLRRRR